MTARVAGAFGVQLKALREAAGFTQHELATIAGLSVHAVSALERGERRRPHVETLRALSAALDLTGPTRDAFLASPRLADRQRGRGIQHRWIAAVADSPPRSRRRRPGAAAVAGGLHRTAHHAPRSWRGWEDPAGGGHRTCDCERIRNTRAVRSPGRSSGSTARRGRDRRGAWAGRHLCVRLAQARADRVRRAPDVHGARQCRAGDRSGAADR